ncbi:MAG: TatD family hydrolase [Patescibacteria group bacterium]
MFKLTDAHCHLQMPQYDADRAEVLARMQEAGMGAIVVGTDLEMSKAAIALAEGHSFLRASVGCHPNHSEQFDIKDYEHLAGHPKVVAIGECGLDYFRSDKTGQHEKFLAHIELAERLGKALIVHCRDAHDDCYSLLQKTAIAQSVPVIIHFCTVSGELAQKYLDLGCYLSFPGPVTFTNMYDDSIRVCPMERMLIETDAPFAAPAPYRGKRNEPLYVAEVAGKIAALKGLEVEEVTHQTSLNFQRIFQI